MHYFLDTGVLIGNVFSLDPLHEYSIKVFYPKANFYFSNHVKDEFEKKFFEKKSSYIDFFRELKFYLKDLEKSEEIYGGSLININKLYPFIDSRDKTKSFDKQNMKLAINEFWIDSNFNDNPTLQEIYSSLNTFNNEFSYKTLNKKREMCEFLIKVPNFKKQHIPIENFIQENDLLHDNDILILLDAHEYALNNKNLALKFITWDKDFFNAVDKLIKNKLSCFDKCYFINDFMN